MNEVCVLRLESHTNLIPVPPLLLPPCDSCVNVVFGCPDDHDTLPIRCHQAQKAARVALTVRAMLHHPTGAWIAGFTRFGCGLCRATDALCPRLQYFLQRGPVGEPKPGCHSERRRRGHVQGVLAGCSKRKQVANRLTLTGCFTCHIRGWLMK